MRHDPATTLLFRPASQQELDLIAASGWVAFPRHLAEQCIFYPVLSEHATQPAHDWNAPSNDVSYLLRFAVDADYVAQFPVHSAGSQQPDELWVPAEELAEFNRHIVGSIAVVGIFHK